MFNLAERWGWRPDATNPVRHIEKYRENRRQRFLSEVEMADLGKALREVELEGSELPSAIAAIRYLILTGCRRGEALGLRWEELDFERGVARLGDSKIGPKTIVLNAPTRALLHDQPRDSEWVFPGRYGHGPLVGLTRPWHRVREAAGLEGVRLHDLRHNADTRIMPISRQEEMVCRGLSAIALGRESA
jgi:integrase